MSLSLWQSQTFSLSASLCLKLMPPKERLEVSYVTMVPWREQDAASKSCGNALARPRSEACVKSCWPMLGFCSLGIWSSARFPSHTGGRILHLCRKTWASFSALYCISGSSDLPQHRKGLIWFSNLCSNVLFCTTCHTHNAAQVDELSYPLDLLLFNLDRWRIRSVPYSHFFCFGDVDFQTYFLSFSGQGQSLQSYILNPRRTSPFVISPTLMSSSSWFCSTCNSSVGGSPLRTSLKCSLHLDNCSSCVRNILSSLLRTGSFGLFLFPLSVFVVSYSFLMSFLFTASSASSANPSIYFFLSDLHFRFTHRRKSRGGRGGDKIPPIWGLSPLKYDLNNHAVYCK